MSKNKKFFSNKQKLRNSYKDFIGGMLNILDANMLIFYIIYNFNIWGKK